MVDDYYDAWHCWRYCITKRIPAVFDSIADTLFVVSVLYIFGWVPDARPESLSTLTITIFIPDTNVSFFERLISSYVHLTCSVFKHFEGPIL
jgi:hypothetical protein